MRPKEELIEIVNYLRSVGAVHIKVADLEAVFLPPQPEVEEIFAPEPSPEENLKTWARTPAHPGVFKPRGQQ